MLRLRPRQRALAARSAVDREAPASDQSGRLRALLLRRPQADAEAGSPGLGTRARPPGHVAQPAQGRGPTIPERPAVMCPDCFVQVPATGVCGMCGQQVA
jgi:hypothetical protein